jgi:hypothetical protein
MLGVTGLVVFRCLRRNVNSSNLLHWLVSLWRHSSFSDNECELVTMYGWFVLLQLKPIER